MVGRPLSLACVSIERALARSPAIGFSAKTGLPSASAAAATCACKLGNVAMATALHVGVVDQRAPVAISLRHADVTRQFRGARVIAAGQRHHLAARVGAERRQLDIASIIAAPTMPRRITVSKPWPN